VSLLNFRFDSLIDVIELRNIDMDFRRCLVVLAYTMKTDCLRSKQRERNEDGREAGQQSLMTTCNHGLVL
jgi:hypothetical protein